MSWRSAATVLEDAEIEQTEHEATRLTRRQEGEDDMARNEGLCSVPECAAAGKLAGHRGSHKGQGPGSKRPGVGMGETVKPPKQPTPSYTRSYPPGVTLYVSTAIVFSPSVLVSSRAVVELGDVRAMVTAYDPELGEITAEVLD